MIRTGIASPMLVEVESNGYLWVSNQRAGKWELIAKGNEEPFSVLEIILYLILGSVSWASAYVEIH